MVTIKDVAKRAGVSFSTVSRALSGKVFVKEETRQRILDAVAALDYRPNLIAQGLKEGRPKTIALIVPNIANPLYPRLIRCIEKEAKRKGYSIVLFDTDEDLGQEIEYVETMRSHFVGGVLLISATDEVSHTAALKRDGIPLVVVNRDFSGPVQCVTNDNHAGAHAMVDYLLKLGHRRIGCLLVDTGMQRYRHRYEGSVRAFREHGVAGYRKYLADKVSTAEEAYDAARKMLAMRRPPTAFFAFIDIIAFGVYSAIYDCGLKIPDDISVAGFDNIDIARHMFPPLTTYDHPVAGIARAAIDCLTARMENPKAAGSDRNLTIDGSIIVRRSTRRIDSGTEDA